MQNESVDFKQDMIQFKLVCCDVLHSSSEVREHYFFGTVCTLLPLLQLTEVNNVVSIELIATSTVCKLALGTRAVYFRDKF